MANNNAMHPLTEINGTRLVVSLRVKILKMGQGENPKTKDFSIDGSKERGMENEAKKIKMPTFPTPPFLHTRLEAHMWLYY